MSRTSGGLANIQGASGLAANRPAAGAVPANFVYIATDTGAISQSNGVATWTALGGGGGGGGLATINTYQPANPAGTVSTVGVMMGLGATIAFTPTVTGKLWVFLSASVSNSVAADQSLALPRFGTGGAPANGAAQTGTLVAGVALGGTGAPIGPVAAAFKITGLAVGTPVWLDVALQALVGGTASLSGINCSIQEVN